MHHRQDSTEAPNADLHPLDSSTVQWYTEILALRPLGRPAHGRHALMAREESAVKYCKMLCALEATL